ncbi:pyridoxamine 5'-phosphate oxidase family protein [Pseudoruegeria sp. SK021]|uniref:pyridoxamine 5'-phosphate oxidase family protein n=1 Tax=Pseudoruegeria sp. SK021 TaxID=1933035 RepID=UPI000A23022D|nr:pyridoxamine 5'-phosphate oxidase family protein [Pseudoruegeria sp. SK021]OSP55528.1 general stress protein [Pseudoruegeria sp. SK021]
MTDLKHEFWDRMSKVRAGMLGIKSQNRLVAMSPQIDADHPGDVWFITAKGTDLAVAVETSPQPARLVIADTSTGLYADVFGTLAHSADRDTLDDVWNFVADAWFEGGQTDPDVRLLRFTPATAEVSVTPGGGPRFLYEIAKANITGDKPDAGHQGTVTF